MEGGVRKKGHYCHTSRLYYLHMGNRQSRTMSILYRIEPKPQKEGSRSLSRRREAGCVKKGSSVVAVLIASSRLGCLFARPE